jgi:hypothetical protein
MSERNKSKIERRYELFAELAGVSRKEIAEDFAEHEKILEERGSRKLAKSGGAAKATAIGAIKADIPNVAISDAKSIAKAIWDYANEPRSLGDLKSQTAVSWTPPAQTE